MSEAERIKVRQGDITRLDVTAVVNAANERMLGGGGVDGAIHRAAGPRLKEACRKVEAVRPDVRCPTGEARLTLGFDLPADFVIHTVGPIWNGGGEGEAELLASAYRSSLAIAAEEQMESVAFPAISTGVYGVPPDVAAHVAVETIREFLAHHDHPARVVLVGLSEEAAETLRAAVRHVDHMG